MASAARVVLGALISHPELIEAANIAGGDDPMVPWLEAARSAGRLKVRDVRLAARLFWGMASGTLFWPPLLEGDRSDADRERLIDELVEIFLARYAVDLP